MGMRRAAVLAVLLLAGCGGASPPAPTSARPSAVATPEPRLTEAHGCEHGATCSTLAVPLDRSRPGGETLDLNVAVKGPRDAPVFVLLSGGPGEPGVSFLPRTSKWLGPDAAKLRLVAFDE